MNLIVAEAEFTSDASTISESVEALASLGEQFLSKLDKLKSMGYQSEAMSAAISANQVIVKSSLAQFASASQPLSGSINSFVSSINEIDQL